MADPWAALAGRHPPLAHDSRRPRSDPTIFKPCQCLFSVAVVSRAPLIGYQPSLSTRSIDAVACPLPWPSSFPSPSLPLHPLGSRDLLLFIISFHAPLAANPPSPRPSLRIVHLFPVPTISFLCRSVRDGLVLLVQHPRLSSYSIHPKKIVRRDTKPNGGQD